MSGCSQGESSTVTTTPPDLTTLIPVPTTVAATTSAPQPAPTLPPPAPTGLCEAFVDPVATGVIESERINEASGIATSRTYPGTLWIHNDSGGGPFVHAADRIGNDLGAFEIDAPAFDWEDMAIGPGREPGLDYLYLGDIGDNFHFRPFVTIYRVAEPQPDPAGGTIAGVATFDLVYPNPGFDSEAMLVDPVTGDLLLITKPRSGEAALVFRAPADELIDGARINLSQVGSFPLAAGTFVTAADIDRTGAAIIFRGYNQVWLWARTDLGFTDTFAAEPCRTPSTAEVQGEAIAFAADGFSYYTISEGLSPDINFVESLLP
ncbi:MAG: hypothetical protein U9N84_07830 [Actinomycetota bacterium]|nr:hypothetical protein [Actinomycetota bacterium]